MDKNGSWDVEIERYMGEEDRKRLPYFEAVAKDLIKTYNLFTHVKDKETLQNLIKEISFRACAHSSERGKAILEKTLCALAISAAPERAVELKGMDKKDHLEKAADTSEVSFILEKWTGDEFAFAKVPHMIRKYKPVLTTKYLYELIKMLDSYKDMPVDVK